MLVLEHLSAPRQTVQSCHAVIAASQRGFYASTKNPPYLVVCGLKSEQALDRAWRYLRRHGISAERFHEPDDGLGWTAIATEPLAGESRKPMRKFQLLKEQSHASSQ